jgi:glycosyltransferase involved in cell wall biosynthesis
VNQSADVSVVIATRNRAASLARTLSDLQRQKLPGIRMEVIVVDNGSVDGTSELIRLGFADLQLVPLYEGIAGKSRSLNLALSRVTGELILFTDDDVSLGEDWIRNYVRAAEKYPECALFCGPIIPEFPSGTPLWLREHAWNIAFFGTFIQEMPEGTLSEGLVPFGANIAVRSRAIAGMQFRLDLGPSEMNGKLMGEDIDFGRQVREKWRDCVYVPSAPVRHHIRPEQVTSSWLCERAFILGRSVMMLDHKVSIVQNFRPNGLALSDDGLHVDEVCLVHYYCGQLSACGSIRASDALQLQDAIIALDASRYHTALTSEAKAMLSDLTDTRRTTDTTSRSRRNDCHPEASLTTRDQS